MISSNHQSSILNHQFRSVVMRLAVMLVDAVGTDVPAAVVTAGNLVVTAVAEQRAAEEELLQTRSRFVVERGRIERKVQLIAAAFAVARAEARQQGGIVIMDAA